MEHWICSVPLLLLSASSLVILLIFARDITLSGSFKATSGTVLLAIYGWTTNPLIEYYIQEDYTSYSGGTHKGTVTSDGSTYDIYENTRTNEPSITGTATFKQYISVRQSKRSSGTVTTANHFNAWSKAGLSLGTFKFQVVATEGFNNAGGSTDMTLS
jgi:endo-1,4-beta-xylanase